VYDSPKGCRNVQSDTQLSRFCASRLPVRCDRQQSE
jgi:hypothetical protein